MDKKQLLVAASEMLAEEIATMPNLSLKSKEGGKVL